MNAQPNATADALAHAPANAIRAMSVNANTREGKTPQVTAQQDSSSSAASHHGVAYVCASAQHPDAMMREAQA